MIPTIRKQLWLGMGLTTLLVACGGPGAPSVKLTATPTSLEDGQVITLKAEVTGAGKMVVEFFMGSQKVGVDDTAPYETSLPLTANDNVTLAFTAKATATGGLAGTSAAVDVQLKVDKVPPQVELSASSPKLNSAGSVTLMAKATDNKGVVKVEFYKGSNKLGESTTPTDGKYSLNVNLDAGDNGTQKYSAKAYDAKGNMGMAEVNVEVDIDVTKPTISLSADKTNVTSAGNVTLTADASDNVGVTKVEFFKGEDKIGEDTEAPFTLSLNFTAVSNGNHTYSAKAFDAKDNSNTSSTLTITVDIDIKNPSVSLSANPTNVTAAGDVVLTADASDDKGVVKVEFYKNGETSPIATDTDGSNSFKHTLSFPHSEAGNGTHGYTAKAYDAQGNTGESEVLSINVDIDATNPTIHSFVASPTSLDAAGTVTLSVAASDQHGMAAAALDNSRIAKVEFYKGTDKLGEDTTRNDGFSHTLNYDATYQGTDSFSAKVFDVAGNSTTSSAVEVSIDIDITKPEVSLSANAQKLTWPNNITLTASASDNRAVTKVEIWRVKTGGDELLKGLDNPTGDVQHELALDGNDNGIVKFYAKAYDAKGNTATSTPQTEVEVEIKPDILFFRQVSTQSTAITLSSTGGTVDLEWDGANVLDYSLEISPSGTSHVIPTPGQPSGSNTSGQVTLPANPTNADITYTVTLKAKSYGTPGLADDTQTLTVTVSAPNPAGLWATTSSSVLKYSTSDLGDSSAVDLSEAKTITGFSGSLRNLAFDASGNLWVAHAGGNTILKYSPADLSDSPAIDLAEAKTITGFNFPTGIAFDAAGNLWVANFSGGNILKYSASDLADSASVDLSEAKIITGVGNPWALAFDASGNLWVTNQNGSAVYKYSASDLGDSASVDLTEAKTITGFSSPAGIAFDAAGNLWVTNFGGGSIFKYSASDLADSASVNLSEAKIITGLSSPRNIAFDASGNLWIANASSVGIYKYSAADLTDSASVDLTEAKIITGNSTLSLAFNPTPANLPLNGYKP